VERHGGEVPRTREELTALAGVGLKTANVVLGNAFGAQAIAVDTHVFRVSQRLGLAKSDDPDEIHDQLSLVLSRTKWTRITHLLQAHGRRTCLARTPACPTCPLQALCPWPGKTRARQAPPQPGLRTSRHRCLDPARDGLPREPATRPGESLSPPIPVVALAPRAVKYRRPVRLQLQVLRPA